MYACAFRITASVMLVAIFSLMVTSAQGKSPETFVFHADWWENAIFYQVYVRSFMDSNADGIGDINGLYSKLDYFKDLGVQALILSPIFKSTLYDYGYDVTDYYSVHMEYGSMEDFENLLKKSKMMDIKILVDFVPNHTSNQSDWFTKSIQRDEYYNDWYIWESGHLDNHGRRQPPNNWVSVFRKSAWTYSQERDQYYLHQFGSSQPDLNFRNPVVVDEMRNIAKFWLEKGVAGMRFTSVNYLNEVDKDLYGGQFPDEPVSGKPGVGPEDYSYLQHIYTKDLEENYDLVSLFRDVFDAISVRDNMTRVMITEAVTGIKNAVRYYGEGIHSGAHIPYNYLLIEVLDKYSDARDVKYAIDRWMTYKPLKSHANWMTGNHDKSRVASRFGSELVDAFNMLVMLLPGIAITYMGEELGMANGFVTWSETKDQLACNTDDPVNFIEVTRDPARTPFHWTSARNAGFSSGHATWLPVADGYENINVENEKIAARSHYQVYRTLSALRRRAAFKVGRYHALALTYDVFAFKRWHKDDTYVTVINFGKTEQIVNLTAFDLIFGQLEVEVSSVLSSRTTGDVVRANYLDLAPDESLVLRMQA